ncbi:MAG: hypothetical protein NT013_20825 [Planctomycetia bacterium]|nr:hypothetical protein [Planctomycetia bacterium]
MAFARLLSVLLLLSGPIYESCSEVAYGEEELPPPWSTAMPPSTLELFTITRETESPQRFENHKFPMRYIVRPPIRGGLGLPENKYLFYLESDIRPLKILDAPSCYWDVSTATIDNGGLLPLCGQIYRWRVDAEITKKGVLQLLPEHELSINPKDSLRVLHLPFDGRLQVRDATRGKMGNVILTVGLNEKGDWVEDSRKTMRVPVHLQCIPRSDRRDLPDKMSELELSRGDCFDAQVWRFKVERIVFPQPNEKIIGWIDLRIMKSEAKEK